MILSTAAGWSRSLQASARSLRGRGNVEVAGAYVLAHPSALLRPTMPARHVLGVRIQVGARLEEAVVEVEIQVMGLDVVHDEHRRHRAREFAEGVEDVLGLKRDARFEPLVVNLSAPPHARAVGPCSRSVRVERAAWAELALGEGLDHPPGGRWGWASTSARPCRSETRGLGPRGCRTLRASKTGRSHRTASRRGPFPGA